MHSANYEWLKLADASRTRELAMQHAQSEPHEVSYPLIAIIVLLAALALWLWVF